MYFADNDNSIKGVGIDMTTVTRFEKMDEAIIDSLSKKILTENEYAIFKNSHNRCLYLAECFCVREAVSKSLGTGMKGLESSDIELVKEMSGKPTVILHGKAKQIATELNVNRINISLTHEENILTVIAIAQ